MITVNDLGIFRDKWVIRNINTRFESGKIYGVIGKSGVGKTTFLKLISGYLESTEGEVLFNEMRIVGPVTKLVPGYDDIQLVDQDFNLDPYKTVIENLRDKILSRHKNVQDELIDEYLELVELNELQQRKAKDLSGGEQQRLAIARALACEPDFLLLDEPFVHLDQRLRNKILKNIRNLCKDRSMGIILVSHDGSEMMGFVEEILHFSEGKLIRQAIANEMYYNPESIEQAQLLGEINSINHCGKEYLFRPNEYKILSDGGIRLKKIQSNDFGTVIHNYYNSESEEEIILYSADFLDDDISIEIVKR